MNATTQRPEVQAEEEYDYLRGRIGVTLQDELVKVARRYAENNGDLTPHLNALLKVAKAYEAFEEAIGALIDA
jgi:hypothetical protein